MDKGAMVSGLHAGGLTPEEFSELVFVRHERQERTVTIEYLLANSSIKHTCVLSVSEFEVYWNALESMVTTYVNPPCIALGRTAFFQYLYVKEAQLISWNSLYGVKMVFEGGGEVCVTRQSKFDAEKLFYALGRVINRDETPPLSVRH